MARNAIESEFRKSKMTLCQKYHKKIKVAYRSEMARNAIESEIRTSKMADVRAILSNILKKSCISM